MPFPVLVSYIINLIRRSLQFELSAFASFVNLPDVSKQAFSQARKKLSPAVFILLNRKLITEFYFDNAFKTFKGFRLLGVDGSTLRLPCSDELYNAFGSHPKEGSVPLAKTSVLYDVLNHLTLHATLAPYHGASEKSMAQEHFEELQLLDHEVPGEKPEDLIVFDRGYPSHFFMFFLRSRNKHFLFRVPENSIAEINKAVKSGIRDSIIDIVLTKEKLRHMPDFAKYLPNLVNKTLKVRVAVFDLSSGEKEILVTSVVDQNRLTYDDLFRVYAMRWNIEEHYKLYKCITEIENFSGESKLAIEQDFFATVFTCNAASLLAQEAQDELNQSAVDKETKYSYKINRNILVGTVKNEILEVLLGNQNLAKYCEKLKKRLKRSLIAIRPGRSYPRPTPQWIRGSIIHKNSL